MSDVFVIAEVGSNWQTYDDCKQSIAMAKAVGADAVKFQAFTYRDLYGVPGPEMKSALPLEWVPKLAARCELVGVEFMCTAFSAETARFIDPYVKKHKVASSDLTDPDILGAVKATGKPVLLSCGGKSRGDIDLALRGHEASAWRGFGDTPVTLLYCNSAYPSTHHNLFVMDELRRFGRPVGLSDHSLDVIYTPLSAVVHFGATVVEKHFKLRADMDTADAPHSLGVDDFKLMVAHLRGRHGADVGQTREEHHMLLRNNRRLIATRDIAYGEAFVMGENCGAYRTLSDDSRGILPFFANLLDGKAAKSAIKAGVGISLIDVM